MRRWLIVAMMLSALVGCEKVELVKVPLEKLEYGQLTAILKLKTLRPINGGTYQGFYHRTKADSKRQGPFEANLVNQKAGEKEIIRYRGQYMAGLKHGEFSEKVFFDNKAGIYYNWEIKLQFKEDKCEKSVFEGRVGKKMYNMTISDESGSNCDFRAQVNKARDRFIKESLKN